jgi:hypothetical protein
MTGPQGINMFVFVLVLFVCLFVWLSVVEVNMVQIKINKEIYETIHGLPMTYI